MIDFIVHYYHAVMEFWRANADSILAVLVFVHLITEYFHYIWEFLTGRKEKNILKDILSHRKRSTKTQRLINIQVTQALMAEDMAAIKKELGIEKTA